MNLVSCERCGVVLDQNKLNFPDIYNHDTQELIAANCVWYDALDKYIPVVNCPVCGNKKPKEL